MVNGIGNEIITKYMVLMLPLDLEYAHEKLTNPKVSMSYFKGETKIYLGKENNQMYMVYL